MKNLLILLIGTYAMFSCMDQEEPQPVGAPQQIAPAMPTPPINPGEEEEEIENVSTPRITHWVIWYDDGTHQESIIEALPVEEGTVANALYDFTYEDIVWQIVGYDQAFIDTIPGGMDGLRWRVYPVYVVDYGPLSN